jgi:hypothetical protein
MRQSTSGTRNAGGYQGFDPTRKVSWLRPGCRSCVFLPRYAALCRRKSCKLNGLNTLFKTGSQEVAGSIPASSTNRIKDLRLSEILFPLS